MSNDDKNTPPSATESFLAMLARDLKAEQQQAALQELAGQMAMYRDALEDAGFSAEDAMQMVRDFQLAIIMNGKSRGEI